MLRSAITRSSATRWRYLEYLSRNIARHASSKPQKGPAKSAPRDKGSASSYGMRKQLLGYRSRIQQVSSPVLALVAVFLFLHIETTYFYAFDLTHGISMLPTMNATGDSVIISKLYRRGKNVHVGDVVSFDHPVDQGVQSIKRVVGLEGDWVCRDTPGIGRGTVIQVPKGHCWVVGDNLAWSRDSRLFGPVPMALIKGKVLARYRLWSDFQWLGNGLKLAVEDDVD